MKKRSIHEIRHIIEEFLSIITPSCVDILVGGSVRRKASFVKDVELIILPEGEKAHSLLDELIASGQAEYKTYGKTKRKRWGQKARGLIYKGVIFDIYFSNPKNHGYISWLRTGDGDSNKYVMAFIKSAPDCPFLLKDGFVWKQGTKDILNVKTEEDFFSLIGCPVIIPEMRIPETYQDALESNLWAGWGDVDKLLPTPPKQIRLPVQVEEKPYTPEHKPKPEREKKHVSNGAWEPASPFLKSNQIYVYEGYGDWVLYDLPAPRAIQYIKLLQKEGFRIEEEKRLVSWLTLRSARALFKAEEADDGYSLLMDLLNEAKDDATH